ncbi:Peptide synthetase [Pyrenophora tritici-repentis]|nr:Peptide synthetase [Pyrenophora tritici-repentis]
MKKSVEELAQTAARLEASGASSNAAPQTNKRADSTFPRMPAEYDFAAIVSKLEQRNMSAPALNLVEDIYPCSPMQENMYVGQKTRAAQLYRMFGLIEVDAAHAAESVVACWQQLVDRHQALRTIYVPASEDSERLLDAVVLKRLTAQAEMREVDSSAEVFNLYSSTCTLERDSGEDSLHRATICSTRSGRLFLILDLSHLVCDGYSITLLIDEFSRALRGVLPVVAAPGYHRFVEYLEEQSNTDAGPALDHWIDFLDGTEPCIFPNLVDSAETTRCHIELEEVRFDHLNRLKTFCQRHEMTLSTFFQVAWAMVLQNYTASPDVCFGYLSSGRGLPIVGVEEIVGPLISLLVYRATAIGDKTVFDMFKTAQEDTARALSFSTAPVAQAQRILGTSNERLFNTLLTTQYTPRLLQSDGVKLLATHNASELEVVVKVMYSDDGLRVWLSYSTSVLSASIARRVSGTLATVMHSLLALPDLDVPVNDVPTLSTEDRQQMDAWNQRTLSRLAPATDMCVHTLIEDTCRRQSTAPAVHAWDGSMSYGELDKAAAQLASFITQLGIGSGATVPLCFEKSVWYTVALLAVLKSGNAFVPMDRSNPPLRLRQMVTLLREAGPQSSAAVALCSKEHAEKLRPLCTHVVVLDSALIRQLSLSPMPTPAPLTVLPTNPAYVIFTSGSTGVPKGVVVEHGAYAHAARAHMLQGGLHLDASSRVLQFASYGFDTSIEDHLTTLVAGACLCVPSEDERMADLAGFAVHSAANWAHLTPSVAGTMGPEQAPGLRTMVLGGEPLTTRNVQLWGGGAGRRLIHVYGPSECCVTTTINDDAATAAEVSDIGRPLPGCAAWISRPDNPHVLTPIGAVGELLVEGPILARGYLAAPDQTSAAFVAGLPWATSPATRLYRTGDLARYDAEGNLHFVGRRDAQVKVRGQRIEPGEIEGKLALEASVLHNAVLLPRVGPAEGNLVAVVSRQRAAPHDVLCQAVQLEEDDDDNSEPVAAYVAHLRGFLFERVPPYMVPDLWLVVREMPYNSSGKLNRKRLQGYVEDMTGEQYTELVNRLAGRADAEPASLLELALRHVWSDVLSMPTDAIDRESSFISLGGDSIAAMRASSTARARGIAVAATDILRHQTIERIAKHISSALGEREFVDLGKTVVNQPWELSPMQQMHFQASPIGDSFDQQTVAVSMTRDIAPDMLQLAFESLMHTHPMLRSRFTRTGSEWTQHVTPYVPGGLQISFHPTDRLEEVIKLIRATKSSIDIENGPMVGVDVFHGAEKRLMVVSIHHLVVDAVSWRVILEDLDGFLTTKWPMRAEPVQFQAWSLAQREYARTKLSPLTVLPILPLADSEFAPFWNMDGQPNLFGDSLNLCIELEGAAYRAFLKLPELFGYDQVDLLLTAISLSFADVFGRSVASLFLEGHGREPFDSSLDLSRTVGWFTTMMPVVAVADGLGLLEALRQVKEFRDATPAKGADYFASRFLTEAGGEAFHKNSWPMEMILNYLGSFRQLERSEALFQQCEPVVQSALADLRREQRALSKRYSLISVVAALHQECLSMSVEWNRNMAHQPRLQAWPSAIKERLESLLWSLESQAHTSHTSLTAETAMPVSMFGVDGASRHLLEDTLPGLGIPRRNIQAIYPCAPIQESLILSQLKGKSDLYNQHFVFRVTGAQSDVGRWERAWKTVVDKHCILRTIFVEGDAGEFMQVVLREVQPAVECTIVDGTRDTQDKTLERLSTETRPLPLPLSRKLLHSLRVHQLDPSCVIIRLDKNHLLTDGVSSRILIQDLLDAYKGHPGVETTPYLDYIKYIASRDAVETESYWKAYLQGSTWCLFPRLLQQVKSAPICVSQLRAQLHDRSLLGQTCRAFSLTAAAVFQAAWALVLRAYLGASNEDELLFGVLASGRDLPFPGVQRIVGPLVNMLPFRCRVTGEARMVDLVLALQDDYLSHLPHQTASLAHIQHAAGATKPLFNTIINIQRPVLSAVGGGVQVELLDRHDASEYDIAMTITDNGTDCDLSIEYASHMLSAQQARHVLAAFTSAVNDIARRPESLVSDSQLFGPLDEEQLTAWNTERPVSNMYDGCIHNLLRETALRQPLQPAVSAWDGDLTYDQLDHLSATLATRIAAAGVQPEDLVALCFEKSMWAVVAMVAMAKSGGAFIHIDPKAPQARAKAIISQTGCRLALTSRSCQAHLEGLVGEVLPIDSAFMASLPAPPENYYASHVVQPTNALYVIFTSGSTGKPKGVVIEHRNFCSAVEANRTWLRIEASSRVLQFTSYSFDASLEEIFTVLVAGGCICTPSEHDRLSDLAGFIRRARVNWAAFTPSFLRSLEPTDVPSLEFITVHAEPMSQALVAKWAGHLHMRPSYGPTECSVTSTVGRQMDARFDAANIGWPIGCVGWVVDVQNRLVPVGAVGELVLDGPIVGRGYFDDVEKTAVAFPTLDFFDTCRRVYKTGDLVRHAEDGSLVFLGRKDTQQVKMRGQRVELGEIQHHLDASPAFSLALVLVPRKGLLQGRLVVVASMAEPDARHDAEVLQLVQMSRSWTDERAASMAKAVATVRDSLACYLPKYMVPDQWLVVGRLPVQTSYKTDRRRVQLWAEDLDAESLRAAQQSRHHKRTQGTELEETIKRIWVDVLDRAAADPDGVGLDDSFFTVGGDSISAMQVMRRCRQTGLPITTQDVLSSQTIMSLASLVESRRQTVYPRADSPVEQMDLAVDTALLPVDAYMAYTARCTPLQQDMWHAFRTHQSSPYLYTTLVELDTDAALDVGVLGQAWQSVVDRHPILRTVFVPGRYDAKTVLQVALVQHCADLVVVAQASETDVIAASRVHAAAMHSHLSHANVPPLALRLFTLPSGRVYALLAMGHMLIDHVSLAHVLHDWDAFCRRPTTAAMLPAPVTFESYARRLNGSRIASNNAFWMEQLRGAQPCLLSSDAAPASAGQVPFSISAALLTAANTFCHTAGLTLSNVLQFAWALLLRHHTAYATVSFAHLASDRDHAADDDAVGPLLSLLVASVSLADADAPVDAARRLQQANVAALAHKAFSLQTVEEHLHIPEPGLFDTLVNFRRVRRQGSRPVTRFRRVWSEDLHRQAIVLSFNEEPAALEALLAYRSDSLCADAAARIVAIR